jgi:hypothetical protein
MDHDEEYHMDEILYIPEENLLKAFLLCGRDIVHVGEYNYESDEMYKEFIDAEIERFKFHFKNKLSSENNKYKFTRGEFHEFLQKFALIFTETILMSFVKKGEMEMSVRGDGAIVYNLTDKGRAMAKENGWI